MQRVCLPKPQTRFWIALNEAPLELIAAYGRRSGSAKRHSVGLILFHKARRMAIIETS